MASHAESLILRSNGARHTSSQPVDARCWHCLSRILLFLSYSETSRRKFNPRYTKLSLSSLLSTCLVGSPITFAPDIKAREKTANNHNLHHPPDSQTHEILLPSKHIPYISPTIAPFHSLPSHQLPSSTHISGVCITPALQPGPWVAQRVYTGRTVRSGRLLKEPVGRAVGLFNTGG